MTDIPGPMDLSPLDPARRAEHWAARLEATRLAVTAIVAARSRLGPLDMVAGWARPILAAAALLLGLLGGAELLREPSARPPRDEAQRLAVLSESALAHGRPPSGAALRAALTGGGRP